ncbi:aminopeptidase [Luteitalea sp. TBR-22]|nr:aminopeptidase [Luteitalea sp. TBR-22]
MVGLLCVLGAGGSVSAQPAGLSAAERDVVRRVKESSIREATAALASDRMEGRGTLQPGGERAAAWIADRMKRLGLAPGGDGGSYLQQVPLRATEFVPPTHVRVDDVDLPYGTDWSTLGTFADLQTTAPVVFVGYGLVSKTFGRDDLKDADLRGKIVVVVDGPPAGVTQQKWDEISKDADLVPTLLARGIVGFINIPSGRGLYPRPFVIDQTARRSISAPTTDAPSSVPLMFFSTAGAERLLAGSGRTLAQAVAEADSATFRPFPLTAKVDVQFRLSRKDGTSPNVIGVIKGSDPSLAAEAVVFSAHYDAFGVMRQAVFNGAADNAIGVAEMLSVAEAFAKAKARPRRSLVFIAFTAEEYGLLGSRHYVAHPTWDLARTAAVLNLDGIGTEIMGPVKDMVAYGAPLNSMGALFAEVARAYGITPMDDPIPEAGVFSRSDHFPFAERGVPGLMLVGSPVETGAAFKERFEAFEATRYHQPSDDIYRDWYWKGARTVADMMALIGHRVAQADAMPTFNAGTPYSVTRGQAPEAGKP